MSESPAELIAKFTVAVSENQRAVAAVGRFSKYLYISLFHAHLANSRSFDILYIRHRAFISSGGQCVYHERKFHSNSNILCVNTGQIYMAIKTIACHDAVFLCEILQSHQYHVCIFVL